MRHEDWLDRWETGQIGFHRAEVNPHLTRWLPADLPRGARVLVPLCGASVDLPWLVAQGFDVTGVELSPIAVRRLVATIGDTPSVEPHGPYTAWRTPGLTLLQGDVLQLDEAPFDLIWDRAATIALPPDVRAAYARVLRRHLKPGGRLLLVSMVAPGRTTGPPFSVDDDAIQALYSTDLHATRLAAAPGTPLADGLPVNEHVWCMVAPGGSAAAPGGT